MKSWILPCVLGLSLAFAGGCAAAGAGAAGAAAAVYYTDRGAESLVDEPVDNVYSQTQSVLNDMGIRITATEIQPDGQEREIKGMKGETEVTVKIDAESESTTQVEVIAQKSAVQWDKDYARKILSEIVEKT